MIEQYSVFQSSDPENRHRAELMAHQLGLPLIAPAQPLTDSQAGFRWFDNKLSLHLLLDGKESELSLDFCEGEVGFRAARVNKSNEVVAKAIGCKPHYRPKVLDATAGMGRDALVMAMLGCQVVMQERHFAIFELLADALRRFKSIPELSAVSEKMSLSRIDSLERLMPDDLIQQQVEVIYLDPMFPERKKSALVKKEMRIFKQLAGEDPDADELLLRALKTGVKRVVVKRPKGAPFLAEIKPTHQITAKKFRYDVYLLH